MKIARISRRGSIFLIWTLSSIRYVLKKMNRNTSFPHFLILVITSSISWPEAHRGVLSTESASHHLKTTNKIKKWKNMIPARRRTHASVLWKISEFWWSKSSVFEGFLLVFFQISRIVPGARFLYEQTVFWALRDTVILNEFLAQILNS